MVNVPDFDRRAADYAHHAQVQQQAAAWLAEWLPARLDEPALELGAGTGFFTRLAMAAARQLRATDVSQRMVEAGRQCVPQADWAVAEASNPPLAAEPYRTILNCSLVQWLPDPAQTFRRWHQISSPGALLLGGWFVRGTMAELLKLCPEFSPFHWRSSEEWTSLLAAAGWRVERSAEKTFTMVHPSSARMLRAIHDIGATTRGRLGAARLRATLRAYDRNHLEAGRLVTPFVFLRVSATRL